MTIQPGGELETRKYWDAEYRDKVSHHLQQTRKTELT